MKDRRPKTNNPQLCRWLNANNSSTRNLPHEVLSSIFELVCMPSQAKIPTEFEDPPKRPRIVLASVCSHWHDVIWNTPQLWPTLSVRIWDHNTQKAASTLQMFADNHTTPKFINLEFSLACKNKFQELLPPLDALLSQQTAPRVRHIGLHDLTPNFTAVAALIKERCCDIQTLYLSCDLSSYNVYREFLSHNLPRPKFEIPTCWPTITTLRLRYIPMDTFFDLLFGCQQLTTLICDRFDPPTNYATKPPSYQARMMTFPYLKHLVLNPFQWPPCITWIDSFSQFYRFPNLKQLHWSIRPSQYSPEPFHTFLSALPISCDTVYFVVFGVDDRDNDGRLSLQLGLEAALAHVGKIKTLVISSEFSMAPLEVMWRLLPDSTFLPSLERFSYYQHWSTKNLPIQVCGVGRLFQGRKEAGVKLFCLGIPDSWFEFLDWENERDELSWLMDDGSFEANVYHGKRKLDIW